MREMRGTDGLMYRIQVSLEDCTGCVFVFRHVRERQGDFNETL